MTKLSELTEQTNPALADLLYVVDVSASPPASCKASFGDILGMMNHVCQGRLTLNQNDATVDTADFASTLWYVPYTGNLISLFNGDRWVLREFSATSINVTGDAGTIRDIFVYDNNGTPALEQATPTISMGLRTSMVNLDGVWVKSLAEPTRRYVGSAYLMNTNQTVDTPQHRYVFNWYNRTQKRVYVANSTAHSYQSATIRGWNNGSHYVSVLDGSPQREPTISLNLRGLSTCAVHAGYSVSIGKNRTNASDSNVNNGRSVAQNIYKAFYGSPFIESPGLGVQTYYVVEQGNAVSAITFHLVYMGGTWEC